METNKITDELQKVKSSFETNAVKANLVIALVEAKKVCEQKEYVVEGSIDKMITDINLEKATLTSKKKLAKKIYFFLKKKSRKTMTAMLSFVRRRFFGEEYRVSIKPSVLEQEIVVLREKYKKLYAETEAARIELKGKKKLFNEKNTAE